MTAEDSKNEDVYLNEDVEVKDSKLAKVVEWLKTRNGKIAAIAAASVLLVGGTATAGVIGAKVADDNDSIGQFGGGPNGFDHDGEHFSGGHQPYGDMHGDSSFEQRQGPDGSNGGYGMPDGDRDHSFEDHGNRPPRPHHEGDDNFNPPADGQLAPTPNATPGTKS